MRSPVDESVMAQLSRIRLKIEEGHYYNFAPMDELLDIDQIALRLGLPKSTVYELTRQRSRIHSTPIPHIKLGRRLKFRWSAVCDWLTQLEKEAQS